MTKTLNLRPVYPRLANYIETNFPLLENHKKNVFKAYVECSGLTVQQASQSLKSGWGPEVFVMKIYPKNGKFIYEKNPNGIILAEDVARKFENEGYKDFEMTLFLESVLMHEHTHWGDMKADGKQQRDKNGKIVEEGIEFEKKAYKRNMHRNWGGIYEVLTAYELKLRGR